MWPIVTCHVTLIQIVVPLEAGDSGASGEGGVVTGDGEVVRMKVMVEWTADNVVSIATEKWDSNWRCSAQVQCDNCPT